MDPKELAREWVGPDRRRLTSRQISIRLPMHVMAKVQALAFIFPGKTRTDYIADLLTAALDRFAEGLPNEAGMGDSFACTDGTFHGARGMYELLWRKHLKELERKEGLKASETGELFEFVEEKGLGHPDLQKDKRKRAPGGPGASVRPTTKARPAKAPGGDQPDRKRRGPRRRPKG
jgi:hypothetical protein